MTSRRKVCEAVAAAALGLACYGCPSMVSMMNSVPSAYARGTWTGRYLVVTMRDHDEGEYPAAAMDIETGPRLLKGSGADRYVDPEHDIVLLCRGQGIIDPSEFNIPVGSKVKVGGMLSGTSPLKSLAPKGSTGGIMEQVRMVSEGERNNNLAIDIQHGKPKVLKE